jgi:hypothetical protein
VAKLNYFPDEQRVALAGRSFSPKRGEAQTPRRVTWGGSCEQGPRTLPLAEVAIHI